MIIGVCVIAVDALTLTLTFTLTLTLTLTLLLQMKEIFSTSNGDRLSAPNVAVFITDGGENVDTELTVPYAVEARNMGIYIVTLAVGTVGQADDTNVLHSIASPPHRWTMLRARYGNRMADFRDRVFMTSCDGIQSTYLLTYLFHESFP